ncbi:hypothetical protein GCM10028805_35820 [Spirosoma harenae]
MQKLLVVVALLLTTLAQAQDYKPFKVNVSVGYAQPAGSGLSGGFLFGIEPKYSVSPRLDLGVRLETALMVRGVSFDNNKATGVASGFTSALLTANYLFGPFGDSNFRPFLGAGLGIFSVSSGGTVSFDQGQTTGQLYIADYSTIGGLARAGIKVGHFVFSIDYNAVPAHTYRLANTTIDFATKSSYTGFRLGFDLGGGRR